VSMDFERLAEAVKFGQAPEAEVHAFLAASRASHSHDPHNYNEHVLADFLQDHDDPRHLLVRRDLGYRTGNSDEFFHRLDGHGRELIGADYDRHGWEDAVHFPRLSDGSRINSTRHASGKLYQVGWDNGGAGHYYVANLTPDEHTQMVEKLGLTHPDA